MTKRSGVILPMEFIRKLAAPFGEGARAWVLADRNGDKPVSWQGKAIRVDRDREFDPRLNHWISTGMFPRRAGGRDIESMLGCAAIVIDDPTTKGDAAKLFARLGTPTSRIATSPDNYHWWYFLKEPATAAQVRPVLAKIVSLGLGDRSGNNPVRYARLNCGVNSKKKYGKPFGVHMVEWTGRRFDIDEIMEALGLDEATVEDEPGADQVIVRASDEELERLIRSGESFHGPMTQLTCRAIVRGEPAKDAARRLRALMFESDGQDDPKRQESWQTTLDNILRMIESAQRKFPQGAVRSRLRRGDKRIIADEENMRLIYENDPALEGLVRFDEFAMQRVLMRPVPGDPAVVSDDEYPRRWRDEDTVAIQQYIQRNYVSAISREKVDGALGAWARSRWAFHPIREYLDRLRWDGKPRIDDWLQAYMGSGGAPRDYLRAVGSKWLISAVARVMDPGCQADCALVLEGGQGLRKSTALRTLAGDDYFSDSLPDDLSGKDASDHVRGKWIIEMNELEQFKRSEIETVKSFISRRVERFRPAYGRNEIEYPRQCVFAGSTNSDQYLVDDTGNRRFWPVTCHGVNLAALKKDRNQLWAEAHNRYVAGERWYLDSNIEALAVKQTERRRLTDPWQDELARIVSTGDLKDQDELRPGQALNALGVETEKLTAFNAARVGKILKALGWRKKASNAKVYVRPEASK